MGIIYYHASHRGGRSQGSENVNYSYGPNLNRQCRRGFSIASYGSKRSEVTATWYRYQINLPKAPVSSQPPHLFWLFSAQRTNSQLRRLVFDALHSWGQSLFQFLSNDSPCPAFICSHLIYGFLNYPMETLLM